MSIRLLAITDGVAPTGLARSAHAVFEVLCRAGFEIHHLASNYGGDPHDTPWKVYQANLAGDRYGSQRIRPLFERIRPHVVFLYNDPWVIADCLRILKTVYSQSPAVYAKVAVWVPIEGDPVDRDWFRDFDIVDAMAVFHEAGRAELLRSVGALLKPPIHVIPLGVDTGVFRPLEIDGEYGNATEAAKAQLALFKDKEELATSFVVLNANRNQPRKRIDITVKAFSLFARDKPRNVKLWLHMGIEDSGWNLVKLAERLGIEDRLIVSSSGGVMPDLHDRDLNVIYNASDVGLNTSSCEGWGLVSFEHAAAGKPQVIPDVPNLRYLWEESGVLAPIDRTVIHERTMFNGRLVNEEALAGILERLYSDRAYRTTVAERSFANARRAEYRWQSVAAQWDRVLRQIVDSAKVGGKA
jgi:D-inositol-3-phosphate glycosyltransferase